MRVITAVWLSIRPELRDDWLSGGDIDVVVDESVAREQAIRGLVHWWHLRRYWDVVGPPGTPGLGLGGLEDGGYDGDGDVETEADVREESDGDDGQESHEDGKRPPSGKRLRKSREEKRKWLEEENDFFRRELEKMEWNWASDTDGMESDSEAGHGQAWDGMPMEAW